MRQEISRDASGFRLRGLEPTRIETFTDAAFAFALTLLVISLEPPTTFAELRTALAGTPAFLLSASMLMMFWQGHHQWSRRYGLDDGRTLVLSCLLVFTVLVYVYPLRFMFGLMMVWIGAITGLPLGSGFSITGPAEVNRLFAVYGVGFSAMSLSLLLLHVHAWRQADALELDAAERFETAAVGGAYVLLTACGMLSTVVALVAPPTMVGIPGWVYTPLAVLMPAYNAMARRRRPQPAGVLPAG